MSTFQTRMASVDGHRIVYDIVGGGPSLMLVPGSMMYRGRWHERGYVERLGARYHVVVVDPLGHGDSDRPHDPSAYTWTACGEHLAAVLDAEGIERAAVWGYSRGAALAAAMLAQHPDRLWAVVMGGFGLEAGSAWSDAQLLALERGDWDEFWSLFDVPLPAETQEWMTERNDPRAIAAAIRGGHLQELEVPAGSVPVLIYNGDGEDDTVTSCTEARARGFECHVLATGGHAQTFAAVDACCELVEPFLESAMPT